MHQRGMECESGFFPPLQNSRSSQGLWRHWSDFPGVWVSVARPMSSERRAEIRAPKDAPRYCTFNKLFAVKDAPQTVSGQSDVIVRL